ncbi:MAG: septation protein SpoVG family protein [Candidatus Omnitrophota bacterium]|nr:SpoVG family protein [Candidatus Omnitrophota bacterium]MBU1929790.1 SpoVG family protein [Candidatus Omnitrophota bacterium]MBU2035208.1 SpoVG family protein [Candidatus Omnitrophota bacterium]MBU2221784.1 SpoVG family protein [Candidatus Omnitrophota bacterium]MBU2258722.1 SpoVG family protein [Candidatus Omnitrophota bacterium]
MEITEVRIFLKDSPDKKLKAYATVTFDNAFVVRNIKVIQGTSSLFIAMPSRRIKQSCQKCGFKNEMRSRYCNQCGVQLPTTSRALEQELNSQSEHKDIAHPITQAFRDCLQKRVLEAYAEEAKKQTGASSQAHL